ncbi:PEP-CTERM sorting domain-containing protein [bacterium]|nr:PEP-CTERM sorting domain-containing protein [bacterium]
MRLPSTLGLAVMLAYLCVSPVGAVPYTALNGETYELETWVGAGANEAVMVVDFNQGGGDVFAFGYRWDGAATGEQMGEDIAAATPLAFTSSGTGGGYFVTAIDYLTHSGTQNPNAPWIPWWGYWQAQPLTPGDLIQWGPYDWNVVPGTYAIAHEGFYAWFLSQESIFLFDQLTPPAQPALAGGEGEIPEPTCLMLLAAGVAGLVARRRRRR